MSHVPERVELYVCAGCQATYAGSVVKTDTGHHYEAPDRCAACGETSFVRMEEWPHHGSETNE
jgi:hypothetical protein